MPFLLRGATAVLCTLACLPALAQQVPPPPTAGRILQQVTPAPPLPKKPESETILPARPERPATSLPDSGVRFTLKTVRFKGNSIYSEPQLRSIVAQYLGRSIGMRELQAIADAVVLKYQRDGYFLANAFFEPQDVSGGEVQVSVLEGTLGRVRVERAPDAPVRQGLVNGFTRRLVSGKPLNQRDLERAMLLLSDLPGIVAQASLEAGTTPGTTDLVIDISKGRRLRGSLDADNYGTYSTGDYRIGGALRFMSPLGLGDALDVRPLVSSDGGVLFGRIGYELPVGSRGARLSAGLSSLTYELQQELAALGGKGYATVAELGLSYPMIRSRGENLFLQAGVVGKKLQDRYSQVGFESDKRVALGSLGFQYERRDRVLHGGYNSVGATLYAGNLWLDTDAERDFDQGPNGRDTLGAFTKLGFSLSRLQAIRGPFTAFLGVSGQIAGKNLDNAERIALGGPYAVRAYPASEGIVDQGWIATAELRWSLTSDLTFSVFYDAARGQISKEPPSGLENDVSLDGAGIGVSWIRPGSFSLRASVAWPLSGAALSDPRDRDPMFLGQAVKIF